MKYNIILSICILFIILIVVLLVVYSRELDISNYNNKRQIKSENVKQYR